MCYGSVTFGIGACLLRFTQIGRPAFHSRCIPTADLKALDCGYEPRVGLFASSSWVRLYKRPCHRLRNTTTVGHRAAAHCRRDSGRTYRPKARTPRSAQHSSRKRLPTLRRFDQRVWRRLKSAFGTFATGQETRTKAALGPGTDIFARVRPSPFTSSQP